MWACEHANKRPRAGFRGHLNAGPSYLALSGGMQDEGIIPESTPSRLVNTVGAAHAVGRHKKAPLGNGDFSGAKVGCWSCWSIIGPPTSLDPSDQSRKRLLHKKGPSALALSVLDGLAGFRL